MLDTRERGTEFRELPVRSALNSAAATHMGFWSINPYIGCEFGCSYCYARDTHRYTVERHTASGDLSPETDTALLSKPAVDAFERHILVKRNIADVLTRTLEPARVGDAAIVIGTATDPYQPAERRFGITRSVLEALLKFNRLHLGIITKSPLITRDIPLLRAIAARHRLKIHVSLATCDGATPATPRTAHTDAARPDTRPCPAHGCGPGRRRPGGADRAAAHRFKGKAVCALPMRPATRGPPGSMAECSGWDPRPGSDFSPRSRPSSRNCFPAMNGTLRVPATPSLPTARPSRGD